VETQREEQLRSPSGGPSAGQEELKALGTT